MRSIFLSFVVRSLVDEGFSGKVRLRGVIPDGLGKEHKSKRLMGSVEDWARG